MPPVHVLFLADSHLGFDLPVRPRVTRRWRGHDFQANYERALAPALEGGVHLAVHGGDVFHRPRVPAAVAHGAFVPLKRIAERGIPVFVVPGNHERARIPHARLAAHPGIRIFDRPQTFVVEAGGARVALSGFPYERQIRTRFGDVLEQTGWREVGADVRLLVIHHCVEGATVGPGNFTFTTAPDVIRGSDLPAEFAAVLSGHIHRHQVLEKDLRGRPLAAPVLYPGSIERTAFAEKGERKGFMTLDVALDGSGGALHGWRFHELPARPMLAREIDVEGPDATALESRIRALLEHVPPDAVLRLRLTGALSGAQRQLLAAARLRQIAPATMNVELVLPDIAAGIHQRRQRRDRRPPRNRPPQPPDARSPILDLGL